MPASCTGLVSWQKECLLIRKLSVAAGKLSRCEMHILLGWKSSVRLLISQLGAFARTETNRLAGKMPLAFSSRIIIIATTFKGLGCDGKNVQAGTDSALPFIPW